MDKSNGKRSCDGKKSIPLRPIRMCAEQGCKTRPSFNYPGATPGLYCVRHKRNGMINIYDNCGCRNHST